MRRRKESTENQGSLELELQQSSSSSAVVPISTRFIMTPLPVSDSDVGGDGTEFRRDFPHPNYRRTLYLSADVTQAERAMNKCWIPTGAMGRNIQALLLAEGLKVKRASQAESYPLVFGSMKAVCDRIHLAAVPENYKRLDQMFYRFANLIIRYEENGRDVTLGGKYERSGFEKVMVASKYARVKTGRQYEVGICVEDRFLRAFGYSVQNVTEPVFFVLQTAFEKDFYAWARYASVQARSADKGHFDTTMAQIVAQIAGRKKGKQVELTSNNISHYKATFQDCIKKLKTLDRSLSIELTTDHRIIVRPEGNEPNKQEIPAPVIPSKPSGHQAEMFTSEDLLHTEALGDLERFMERFPTTDPRGNSVSNGSVR